MEKNECSTLFLRLIKSSCCTWVEGHTVYTREPNMATFVCACFFNSFSSEYSARALRGRGNNLSLDL